MSQILLTEAWCNAFNNLLTEFGVQAPAHFTANVGVEAAGAIGCLQAADGEISASPELPTAVDAVIETTGDVLSAWLVGGDSQFLGRSFVAGETLVRGSIPHAMFFQEALFPSELIHVISGRLHEIANQ